LRPYLSCFVLLLQLTDFWAQIFGETSFYAKKNVPYTF
jgi:hypothetical protein